MSALCSLLTWDLHMLRWRDGHERTWEPEANLTRDLIAAFEQEQSAKGIALRGSDADDSQVCIPFHSSTCAGARAFSASWCSCALQLPMH